MKHEMEENLDEHVLWIELIHAQKEEDWEALELYGNPRVNQMIAKLRDLQKYMQVCFLGDGCVLHQWDSPVSEGENT